MTILPTEDSVALERKLKELERELSQAKAELNDAREQQATTAKILGVISDSPAELHQVFATLAVDAARLCNAFDAAIYQVDGEVLRVVAHHGPIDIGAVGDFTLPLTRDFALGRAVIERRPLHIADLQAEGKEYPEGRDYALRWNFHTQLAVPLIKARDALGVIVIRRAEVRPFTDRQIELLRTFADQAIIAIENTRLFEAEQASKRELQKSLEYQKAMSEVLNVISRSPTNVQPVFDAIVESAARLCDAVYSVVWLFDGELLHYAASHNFTAEVLDLIGKTYPRRPDRSLVAGRALLDGMIAHVPDLLADPDYAHTFALAGNWRSSLSVPMLRNGKSLRGDFHWEIGSCSILRPAGPAPRYLRRPSCHRDREHAPLRGGTGTDAGTDRILAAADGNSRRAQGHKSLSIRFAVSTAGAGGISGTSV
jgi:two-component system, NtrC family, sensor kinase